MKRAKKLTAGEFYRLCEKNGYDGYLLESVLPLIPSVYIRFKSMAYFLGPTQLRLYNNRSEYVVFSSIKQITLERIEQGRTVFAIACKSLCSGGECDTQYTITAYHAQSRSEEA